MYHSVTFGSKNSYSDWHLVPDSRPVITMPEQKKEVVDVPGSNGVLDMSMALTKYPIFNRRSGSLKFHVLNDYSNWKDLYEEIAFYLHGRKLNMWLEDDSSYYYSGYYNVLWTSNNDGTWSDIEIGYDLEPYKYARDITYFGNAIDISKSSNSSGTISGSTLSTTSSLPTPLIITTTNSANSPKISIGFNNPKLSINENLTTVSGNYVAPYTITGNGTYTIQKYPICGDTVSEMRNIVVRYDIGSMSTSSSAAATIRAGFRRALL